MALASKVINQAGAIREFEKPEVCEAIEVANVNKWTVSLSPMEWHEREARLKKEYGKNHIKGDFSGNKSIEHCGEPAPGEEQSKENSLKAATDAFILQANEIMRLKKKNAELLEAIDKMKEGNPALEESASQFNEALLDEQAKKIKRLGKEIARLNGIIHDKNAILSDVAEELRLTKIREKNLAELGLKYVGENEELKKKLADKVVDKINANALKSAESALAYKEKVIAEKDEVIADLGNELEATKKELEAFKESYKRRIKEDSEHFEHIQKICNAGLQKWLIESEYLEKDKPFRFPQQPELSEEELMKLQEKACVDMAEEGKDHSGVIVLCGKDLIDALKKVKDVWQE